MSRAWLRVFWVVTVACTPRPELAPMARPITTQPAASMPEVPPPAPPPASLRSPERIMAEGNHLLGQRSAYLAQHAHNPVDWYPWGEEALERARREDKPIFLSIGYASCHWCHVMEHGAFSSLEVASFLNQHFVSIKVDREERPDLDAVYMDAVQAMTGGGGWPMSVFLTPSLKPFFGGTYFPEDRFLAGCRTVLDTFRNRRNQAEDQGAELYARIAGQGGVSSAPRVPPEVIRTIVQNLLHDLDPVWGGSRTSPKFPTPPRWRAVLHAYRRWGDPEVGQALRVLLDQMASGGIRDHVGGGFHRYATDRQWVVPHFEKMLYDNAQLASLYLEASVALAEPRYLEVARDTLDFLARDMREPGSGFFASYDADSGGEEGTTYVWTPDDLAAIAGPTEGAALAQLLGVTPEGNFTVHAAHGGQGRRASIPTRRAPGGDSTLWERWRPALAEARTKRVQPGLDKKVVASWNGLALVAFAEGHARTGELRYRAIAEEVADFLWRVHRAPGGGLLRASNGGLAEHPGVLDDYADLALGMLALYEATGTYTHLARAADLVGEIEARFDNPEGGWYLTAADVQTPLGRKLDPYDSVEPSGASAALLATWKLASVTGDERLYARVDKALTAYGGPMRRAQLQMAGWLDVALWAAGPFYDVVIAGRPEDPSTIALREAYRAVSPAWAVLSMLGASGPSEAELALAPALRGKSGAPAPSEGPLAYVCVRASCKKPTADPAELRRQVVEGWIR
jgi:uncharacterized protein YyaL (SSP411 family)